VATANAHDVTLDREKIFSARMLFTTLEGAGNLSLLATLQIEHFLIVDVLTIFLPKICILHRNFRFTH
jgi:hypothetical protein